MCSEFSRFMMRFHMALAGALISAAMVAPASAFSQPPASDTASVTPAAVQVNPGDLPMMLTAGPVTGELTATSLKGIYTAGGSAFAQLKLSSETEGRRGVSAELLLQAQPGEVVDVEGSGVETKRKGDLHLAHIDGIRKGHSRTVLIEVRLKAAADKTLNRLTLTLRAPDQNDGKRKGKAGSAPAEKTVALAWPVADCGGKFHDALHEIGEKGGANLRGAWRGAMRPDKSMSRHWLFRPSMPRRGRRHQDRDNEETATRGLSASEVRAIYREVDRLTSAGYDRSLRESGDYGEAIAKVALDLRRYFRQDMKPAICTGAIGFAQYHEERLSPLRKHGERLAALTREAEALARAKAGEVFAAARDLPGGHPGWGGATLASLTPPSDETADMKALLVELLEAANFSPERIEKVKSANSVYDALAMLDESGLKGEAEASVRDELRDALAAVEAAVRLAAFKDRQQTLWNDFHSSLEAIRSAHAELCVCGS